MVNTVYQCKECGKIFSDHDSALAHESIPVNPIELQAHGAVYKFKDTACWFRDSVGIVLEKKGILFYQEQQHVRAYEVWHIRADLGELGGIYDDEKVLDKTSATTAKELTPEEFEEIKSLLERHVFRGKKVNNLTIEDIVRGEILKE